MQKNNLIASCQTNNIQKRERPPLPNNENKHTKFNIQIIKLQKNRACSNQFFSYGKLSHKTFFITKTHDNDQKQNSSFDQSAVQPVDLYSSSSMMQYPDFQNSTSTTQMKAASSQFMIPKMHHNVVFTIYKTHNNNNSE